MTMRFPTSGTILRCKNDEIAYAIAVLEGIKSTLPITNKPVIVETDNASLGNDLIKLKDALSISFYKIEIRK
jgi:hypothetical protein